MANGGRSFMSDTHMTGASRQAVAVLAAPRDARTPLERERNQLQGLESVGSA